MKKIIRFVIIIMMLLALSGCQYLSHFAPIPEGHLSHETLNKITFDYIPGSVFIKSEIKVLGETTESKTGSGVIFDEDDKYYYILTNEHVVYVDLGITQKHVITVSDYLAMDYEAKLLYQDVKYDLAILRINKYLKTKDSNFEITLHVFDFANKNPEEYDVVYALSSPNGQRNAITAGRVTYYTDPALENGEKFSFLSIAHSATIYPGSSGSVLLNEQFKVIGINYAIGKIDDVTYSLSIPVIEVKKFIADSNYLNVQ